MGLGFRKNRQTSSRNLGSVIRNRRNRIEQCTVSNRNRNRIENRIDGRKRRKAIGNRAEIDIQPTPYRTWYTLWKITIYISREEFTRYNCKFTISEIADRQTNRQNLVWGNSCKWDITLGCSFPIYLFISL